MNTPKNLSVEILGQIALMQSIVAQLPNTTSMLNFVCRGFKDVSGVENVKYLIYDSEMPSADYPLENDSFSYSLPITHKNQKYADLLFQISDRDKFAPYIPFIENFGSMLGIILGERYQRKLNDSIMKDLERRVRKRTRELDAEIAERKRSENALSQLNETLEQRVAERSSLAETRAGQLQSLAVELIEAEERERHRIAHLLHEDLQQDLAAARFQLQALHSDLSREPELEMIEQLLNDAILKMRHLTHELSPVVLHHSSLTGALKWLGQHMLANFGLHVLLELENADKIDSLPLKVFLFRAVQEFLFNTIKHSGVKKARVSLLNANEQIVITVSDSGKGFDPAILDKSTARSGMGLISLRERASYIGGDLMIDSATEKGSRITLTVPLEISKNYNDRNYYNSPIGINSDENKTAEIAAEAKRVLFADDHKVMRQGLIKLISGQPDIQVVGEAANGLEALAQVKQLKPDVVVMDISMPEMDGIEATRRIKAEAPNVRVIGLSMFEDEQTIRLLREAGAESFVSKTASPSELLEAIYGFDRADKRENRNRAFSTVADI